MPKYTILLIDYEPRSIEQFRRPLLRAGYEVELATDGLSGIATFHRVKPDLVLIEAMIPKKHGFEVCQEIKKTADGKRTPVLITTAVYKGRRYRTQALHIYGCDEYLEKPVAEENLLAVVRRLLGDEAVAPTVSKATAPPPASDPPAAVAPSEAAESAEQEILARLDAILPPSGTAALAPPLRGPGRPPRNEHTEPPGPEGEVVAFDPGRSRRHRRAGSPREAPAIREVAEMPTGAAAAMPALALEPSPDPQPQVDPRPQEQPIPPATTRRLASLLWVGLAVAIAVALAGWLLYEFIV